MVLSFIFSVTIASLPKLSSASTLSSPVPSISATSDGTNSTTTFNWLSIKPSETQDTWVPCYGMYRCARYSVPMNWNDPEGDPRRVDIALIKLPAKVSESCSQWKGPILINPGGPGGSGVEFALSTGQIIQSVVGDDFSIIGFDPRGVSNTTPQINCFPSPLQREVWGIEISNPLDNHTLPEAYARSKALGMYCSPIAIEKEGAEFVNTPSVARDMLEITEGAWKSAGYTNSSEQGLLYWGISYGSLLGQTFASMFPDRVTRLIVDGVADIHDYYSGLRSKDITDSPKVMDAFFEYCSLAGPKKCAFHGGESPSAIRAALDTLLESLAKSPVPVITSNGPDILSRGDILSGIFQALYSPMTTFKGLAAALAAAESGDAEVAGIVAENDHANIICDTEPGPPNTSVEAAMAIFCSDAMAEGNNFNLTIDEQKAYTELMNQKSPYTGSSWAKIRMACVGWNATPKYLYNGTYGKTTKEGLLFIGNTADPVTPLINAENMSKLYPNSGLLVQNSVGHESFTSLSECTNRVVRAYFREGTLPQKGTVCEVEELPFDLPGPERNRTADSGNTKRSLHKRSAIPMRAPAFFGKGKLFGRQLNKIRG